MPEPSGELLAQGLAEGREEAFAALYDRHGPALFRVARAMLGSTPDAEDAVQELFVGLVRVRRRLGAVENLQAYLFAALRHAVAKIAAHRLPGAAQADALDQVAAPTGRTGDAERSARLERAVRALPCAQRELVALKIDGGLTFVEIAVLLGISPNTAASRYRYALEKLRDAMKE
jgi:RNA polymerase sigma-70 factor (ECF subfamily)